MSSTLAFDSTDEVRFLERYCRYSFKQGAGDRVIFENCIEKNFHVSQTYESGHLICKLDQMVQFSR